MKLKFHGTDTDTDADFLADFRARIRARKSARAARGQSACRGARGTPTALQVRAARSARRLVGGLYTFTKFHDRRIPKVRVGVGVSPMDFKPRGNMHIHGTLF